MSQKASQPTGVVTNAADAERTGILCGALLAALSSDERVIAAYGVWRAGHDLPARFARLAQDESVENKIAVRDAILSNEPADDQLATGLVADLAPEYPWLAQLLVAQWRTWALNEVTGENNALRFGPRQPSTTIERVPGERAAAFNRRARRAASSVLGLPPGRRGKRGDAHREDLPQNVAWYYRAHLKQPPDTIAMLTREYVAKAQRATPAHSVIRCGIKRAQSLLAGIALPPTK